MAQPSQKLLPMTRAEMTQRGWTELDVLLVSGDAYVDHPSFGAAVIGRVLETCGFRTGIIAQPDWHDPESVKGMGRPRLFCGVTAGNLDSMLANYTAARRKRTADAYSEGGMPGRRPNHATVVYTQLVKQAFAALPVVLGGVEASLRRVAHYDYWQDQLRPSVLVSSKADILVYGMGETAVREIAERLLHGRSLAGIRGTAVLLPGKESEAIRAANADTDVMLPSFEDCRADIVNLLHLTKQVESEQNPFAGRRLVQFHGGRALVIEPPGAPLSEADLDAVYALPYTGKPHPIYRRKVPAHGMIEHSITVVRGCAGGCSFCGLGLHQGRFLESRSKTSILEEARRLVARDEFRGTITDLGGPTANLYGCRNGMDAACRRCRRASCLFPAICPHFQISENAAVELLESVRQLAGVKHLFISSGLRMDVALHMPRYLRELIRHHVSGHLKVAPEHLNTEVLRRMRKPDAQVFEKFREIFERESQAAGKEQYLVPYFISNFPSCGAAEMRAVEQFIKKQGWKLQQVQDFIPLPMTAAAAMYCTGLDYETEKPIPVVRGLAERRPQMRQLRPHRIRRR